MLILNFFKTNKIVQNTFSKWMIICLAVGILSGTVAAFFLTTLNWVTIFRMTHPKILYCIPIGGLLIGVLYHYKGKDIVKGNNLLLEEYDKPKKKIPLKMVPFIYIGTLITHLFGGSAGREGTAVQMGGAIADQFSDLFNLTENERRTILLLGISAGFAAVFGTPLAGALFALEITFHSAFSKKSLVLSFIVAYIAAYTVSFWNVSHTHYRIPTYFTWNIINFVWLALVSILFGLFALLFAHATHFWNLFFSKTIAFPPYRPMIGGVLLVIIIVCTNTQSYEGLGIQQIQGAFYTPADPFAFLIKIGLTSLTLGAGFKGGEVTPLFFIGATLGSALAVFVPLPISLLTAVGFVAVFAGATHTPIACAVMGLELFGFDAFFYVLVSCSIAYFASGTKGIYSAQILNGPKIKMYKKFKTIVLDFL